MEDGFVGQREENKISVNAKPALQTSGKSELF